MAIVLNSCCFLKISVSRFAAQWNQNFLSYVALSDQSELNVLTTIHHMKG